MSARGLRVAAVLSVLTVVGAAVAQAESIPVISVHRAAVSGFAENSLSGFRQAAEGGETDLEGDVFATRDGVLVVSHDSPLVAPGCEGPYLDVPLRELDAAQVEQMSCHGEPVARLAEVVEALLPYPGVTLRIEMKNTATDSAEQRTADALLLAGQLAESGMTGRSILQDFDWATTTGPIRSAFPAQRVSALATSISTTRVNAAQAAGAHDYSYPGGLSTAFWNRYVAAKGLRSVVWTVNDTVRARAVRAENVGTVITDVPDALREAFAAPGSGCTLARYSRNTAMRSWSTPLVKGARLYLKAPTTAPDGRIVETTLLKVNARTVSGTGSLRVGPQGTPYSLTWEKSLPLTTTWRSTVVEVPIGNAAGLRIRNTSSGEIRVTASAVGGTVYTCP